MDPKFLHDLVEEFFLNAQTFAEPILGLRFCLEACKHSIHQRDIGVVSTEEKVVGMPVTIGMHENGATRVTVAAGATDLLVIPFHTARQRGVNHGSNIRLIDRSEEHTS